MKKSNELGLIGIPYDANSSFLPGPRFAPDKIREVLRSDHWNMTSENGTDLEANPWKDLGDLNFEGLDGEGSFNEIQASISTILDGGFGLVSLGGDHSVSYPVIKAHAQRYPKLNVLHIDAHPDLYENLYDNRFSHASPFARLLEDGVVNRLVQVGIRTLNAHQREQAQRFGVEIIEMGSWRDDMSVVE